MTKYSSTLPPASHQVSEMSIAPKSQLPLWRRDAIFSNGKKSLLFWIPDGVKINFPCLLGLPEVQSASLDPGYVSWGPHMLSARWSPAHSAKFVKA